MHIEMKGFTCCFAETEVLDHIDFDDETSTLAIIGPSGGGKSTLLRILGGLLLPTSGELFVDGVAVPKDEAALTRYRATLGFVFQDGGLFHHLSARENIALPLRVVHGVDAEQAAERAENLLLRFGLEGQGDKRPAQLSGGQRQRVAIARAVAPAPRMLPYPRRSRGRAQEVRLEESAQASAVQQTLISSAFGYRLAFALGEGFSL